MAKLITKLFEGLSFEKQTDIYKFIGVTHYKKIVPLGDLWIKAIQIFKKNFKIIRKRYDALIWVVFTLIAEFMHHVVFLIIAGFIIKNLIITNYQKAIYLSIINLFLNVYPALVQRYNRIRLIKIFNITMKDIRNFRIEL